MVFERGSGADRQTPSLDPGGIRGVGAGVDPPQVEGSLVGARALAVRPGTADVAPAHQDMVEDP